MNISNFFIYVLMYALYTYDPSMYQYVYDEQIKRIITAIMHTANNTNGISQSNSIIFVIFWKIK